MIENINAIIIGPSKVGKSTMVSSLMEDNDIASLIHKDNTLGKTKLNMVVKISNSNTETSKDFQLINKDDFAEYLLGNISDERKSQDFEDQSKETNEVTGDLNTIKKNLDKYFPKFLLNIFDEFNSDENIVYTKKDLINLFNNKEEHIISYLNENFANLFKLENKSEKNKDNDARKYQNLIISININTKPSSIGKNILEKTKLQTLTILDTKGLGDKDDNSDKKDYEYPNGYSPDIAVFIFHGDIDYEQVDEFNKNVLKYVQALPTVFAYRLDSTLDIQNTINECIIENKKEELIKAVKELNEIAEDLLQGYKNIIDQFNLNNDNTILNKYLSKDLYWAIPKYTLNKRNKNNQNNQNNQNYENKVKPVYNKAVEEIFISLIKKYKYSTRSVEPPKNPEDVETLKAILTKNCFDMILNAVDSIRHPSHVSPKYFPEEPPFFVQPNIEKFEKNIHNRICGCRGGVSANEYAYNFYKIKCCVDTILKNLATSSLKIKKDCKNCIEQNIDAFIDSVLIEIRRRILNYSDNVFKPWIFQAYGVYNQVERHINKINLTDDEKKSTDVTKLTVKDIKDMNIDIKENDLNISSANENDDIPLLSCLCGAADERRKFTITYNGKSYEFNYAQTIYLWILLYSIKAAIRDIINGYITDYNKKKTE